MKKKEIVDDVTMKRAITRITYEIIERNKNLDKIVLAGIKTRGVYIAQRIQERLKQLENLDVPLIELDTKAFRDDVKAEQDTSVFPIEIDGTDVILVDDVLYTGRTIRAAIDNIVSHGRPARVGLAVLVDRGHRDCQFVRTMLVKISQQVSRKKSKFWSQKLMAKIASTLSIQAKLTDG